MTPAEIIILNPSQPPKLETLTDRWITTLRISKHLASSTVKQYRLAVDMWLDWLSSQGIIDPGEALDFRQVENYLVDLVTVRKIKQARQRQVIAALRSLAKWLAARGEIDSPKFDLWPSPRLPRRLPKYLTLDAARTLLAVAKEDGPKSESIVTTLIYTGIRVSELITLRPENISIEEARIQVIGKGDKARAIPLHQNAAGPISRWMAIRPKSPWVYPGRNVRKHATARSVEKTMSTLSDKASIDPPATPHTLRHTCATALHAAGADILEIQAILGHASIQTTQI